MTSTPHGSAFRLSSLSLGLAAGNFAYQLATACDWHAATERSFFQAVALFAAWLTVWMKRLNNKDHEQKCADIPTQEQNPTK